MNNKKWFSIWPTNLPYFIEYPKISIDKILEKSAEWFPDKDAIIFYGKRLKYKEVWNSVKSLSSYLIKLGIKQGDRVGIMMQNSPNFLISFFAIARSRATIVLMNPMMKPEDASYIVRDANIKTIITTGELLPVVLELKEKHRLNVISGSLSDYLPEEPDIPAPDFVRAKYNLSGALNWNDALNCSENVAYDTVNDDDEALIAYTSGTTGTPRGCIHTHQTVIANAMDAAIWRRLTPSAVELSVTPFFHVTGLSFSMLSPVFAGATLVILSRWSSASAIGAIEKYRCTHWVGVSTMFADLLTVKGIEDRDFSSIRFLGGGGAAIPKTLIERMEKLIKVPFVEGYGLTETMGQTHINPPEKRKLQCIGIPQFGYDAMIVNPETGKPIESGVGEIVVSGPTVFKGYLNKMKETEEAFVSINGKKFLRTGDLGYMDDEGSFFVIDRLKRMINRGGFKVWPSEIDSILSAHPAIKEVCVVGTPDPRVGEEVKAFVVLAPGHEKEVTEIDIVNWARERMAAYKYPRIVEFVDDLPKTASGKINWRLLQENENKKKYENSVDTVS